MSKSWGRRRVGARVDHLVKVDGSLVIVLAGGQARAQVRCRWASGPARPAGDGPGTSSAAPLTAACSGPADKQHDVKLFHTSTI